MLHNLAAFAFTSSYFLRTVLLLKVVCDGTFEQLRWTPSWTCRKTAMGKET